MRTRYPMLLALLAMVWATAPPMLAQAGEGSTDEATPPSNRLVIVDFSMKMDPAGWQVEDDVVMGGRSKGSFSINSEGRGVFSGEVSLENDGGFSSVQHYFDPIDVSSYRWAMLRVRGDGKRYQFLVEAERNSRHYYVHEFETTGEWQTVKVPLADMYPVYRGDRLTIPNYPGKTLAMVRLFIANRTPESFRLEIESIWLE